MALPITRDTLRAAYEFLNETPPFSKWNLPDADDVMFVANRSREAYGMHYLWGEKHVIEISTVLLGYTVNVLAVMAHEMIHLHEKQVKATVPGVEHSAAFRKWAAQVCRIHGFDPKMF